MNAKLLSITALLLISIGANAQLSEERYQNSQVPNNSLENTESYAHNDIYKSSKAKNALVYGRDYIFQGYSASDVDSVLINQVDPYSYLHQFKNYENVTIHIEDLNINLILFARMKRASVPLSVNE